MHASFKPIFKLSTLTLSLLSATAYANQADPVNLPAVEVTGQSGTVATVTENSNEYTIPAMSTATGMKLTDKETPQATSVITNRRIKDQKLNTVTDVMQQTNGVFVSAIDRGRSSFYARGFQIDKYQVDGLNVTFDNQRISGENLENLIIYDHVEVVRGANGLTSGNGDPSARVNLIRKHADSKTRRTAIEAGYGRWNQYSASIDHTQPLNAEGSVRGRIIASRNGGKSFVDFEKSSQNILYGIIDADIGDKTRLSFGASYRQNNQDSYMWGGLPLAFSDGSQTDWPRSKTTSTKWSYWNSTNSNYFVDLSHRFNNDWQVALKADHSRSSGKSKLAYMYGSVDKTTGLGYGIGFGRYEPLRKESNVQISIDGRYPLFGRKHELFLGGQFGRNYNTAVGYPYQSGTASESLYTWSGNMAEPDWGVSTVPYTSTAHDRGLFAATRLNITDRLGVVAGMRLANYKRERSYYGIDTSYRSGNIWLPYGGLTFDINDKHTIYASYTDSFKTQYQLDVNGQTLDPTRGKNYEVGLKSSYFNDRLQSQLNVFRVEQDNLAQRDGTNTVIGMPAGTAAYYNAKGVRTHGYEIELNGRLTPQWNISAGFTSARGKDASGNQVNTNVPMRQFKLYTTYDFSNRLAGLTVGGGVNWQSGRYYDGVAPLSGKISESSYALVNLMARYRVNKQLSAQVNVDNLFDKKHYNEFSSNQVNYGTPRNIRASVRYEF
ncbi:TonB-dependent siderophore receptor [Neisseria dentiae]|uniref:TonB-dependent siderophore receptor n=1 Tax=Neisseria dentiae TaxID=194197 RepID=UPI00359F5CAB